MEKEAQPDSMATVTIKPEYPPSEVYSSEPPPAYHRSQSSAVQVAKIIAVTVVLMSVILGGFLLASAYITANASCRQLEQELEFLNEAADKFQGPLQPEALIQEEQPRQKEQSSSRKSKSSEDTDNEINNNSIDSVESDNSDNSDSNSSSNESEEEEKTPIHFKLPLQLDFDDLAGALIEKNQKSRMNCIVEKKRAEEVVDHQPKTLRLPFGLNLTTDPRYERISGERMAIFCESGDPQKQSEPEDDSEEETIMIQPVMIPIPQTHFPTHMAQQLRPVPVPQQNQFHPMENMRPPVAPLAQRQMQQNQFPPNQILHHIAQQIIAQKIMEAQKIREEQQNHAMQSDSEQSHLYPAGEVMQQRIPISEEVLTQLNRLPNRDVVVTVSQQDSEDLPQKQQEVHIESQEMRMIPQEMRQAPQEMHTVSHEMRVASPGMQSVSQDIRANPQDAISPSQEMRGIPQLQVMRVVPQEIHVVQQERDNTQENNGRETYARGLPVHIPVHMIQQEHVQPVPSEETRPHYVQPRSVRSVDEILNKSQKRVKRCSCDCAC